MYQHACKLGLEGVVSKVRDSAYVSGRGNIWVKKTSQQRETLTIAGFALDGQKWDGIYLARRKGNDLIYAGKVDHGFDNKSAADLRKRLRSSTAPSLPKGRCGIPSFWVCARGEAPKMTRSGQGQLSRLLEVMMLALPRRCGKDAWLFKDHAGVGLL
jgi:ATP-dependent DNA ligase